MATTTASTTTVSEVLAAELAAIGVRSVFSLMGEDTAALVTALVEAQDVDVYTTRHEAQAVMGADGYSWATGGLGVAVLSHGPGFSNGLNAATTAAKSERQVLIVAGHDAIKSGMKPEMKQSDQAALSAAAGLGFFQVHTAADAVEALRGAVECALTGRPAVLSVPVDVLNGKAAETAATPAPAPTPPAREATEPSQDDIDKVVALLAQAKRPLVMSGRGGIHAKDELIALAERTGALLGTSLLGKDIFRGHRLDLGIVGGWASDAARPLLDELDLVLVFGASLNSFTMAFGNIFQSIPIVQVEIDPLHIGAYQAVQLGVVGDSRLTAERLLAALPEPPADPELHRPEILEQIAQPLYLGEDESSETEADPRVLATILDELLPENRSIVTDGGHFMGYPGMYIHVPAAPDRFRQTSSFASIGLGIGAAMGAAVARPGEQTVFFAGDGGLMMSLGDLETVVRYKIPLTIVVMDDRALGAERHFLDLMGISHKESVFGDVDFAGVARALGMESETVRSPDDLRALAPKLSSVRTEPILIDCKIRGDLRARWLEEIE